METFDYVVMLASLAGLMMVMGGIVLIYKGALVLASTDPTTALSIEWKQTFKLNTQAPGIAFFIIGLAFSAISIYAAKPEGVEPIRIEGEVADLSEPVTIRARSLTWTLDGGSHGIIKGTIHPQIDDITLEISAPGYKPENIPIRLSDLKDRTVKFDEVALERRVSGIAGRQVNIISAPTTIAPITAQPSFGASQ